MRRPALATILVAILAAGAIIVAVLVVGSPATSSAQERTVTVARGVVQSTVSGSGNLSPANQVELNFATSGQITKIYVKEGDHVGQDQVLAKLDDSAAKVQVAEAQASLQSAQDTLAQVQSGSSGTTTASNTSARATTAMIADTSGSSGGERLCVRERLLGRERLRLGYQRLRLGQQRHRLGQQRHRLGQHRLRQHRLRQHRLHLARHRLGLRR